MAMIYDDCDMLVTELLVTTQCANCHRTFREDESEWMSLCQECGEIDDTENP